MNNMMRYSLGERAAAKAVERPQEKAKVGGETREVETARFLNAMSVVVPIILCEIVQRREMERAGRPKSILAQVHHPLNI